MVHVQTLQITMTQFDYIKIFSIKVSHTYFENEIDQNVVFKPQVATQAFIEKYSFKIRQDTYGLQVYVQSQQPIYELLEYIHQTDGINLFDFDILAKDPNFYIYTELPLSIQGPLLYSSEDELNQFENESIRLHLRIGDARDESVFGELQISFDDIINNLNSSVKNEYEIRFDARSTRWQYYIIYASNIHYDTISIKGSSGIEFSDPIEVSLPNGDKALLMTSTSLIPLSNIPKFKFDLINSKTDGTTIFSGLPNPDPNALSLTEIDGEMLPCSPAYIYI